MHTWTRRLSMIATSTALVAGSTVSAAAAATPAAHVIARGAQVALLPSSPACADDYATGNTEGYRAGFAHATAGKPANVGSNPCPSYPNYTSGYTAGYTDGYNSAQLASADNDNEDLGDNGAWGDDNGWGDEDWSDIG